MPEAVLAAGFMGLCLALPDHGMAQSGATAGISVGTLKGTYIYSFRGYNVEASGTLITFAVADADG